MKRLLAALAAIALLAAACTSSTADPSKHRSTTHHRTPTAPATSATGSATATPPPTGVLFDASGHGWRVSGVCATNSGNLKAPCIDGPRYPAGACHSRSTPGGLLPDPVCTPGAIDGNVVQSNIGSTICVRGYTTTIRPPLSLTGPAKTESAREYGTTTAAGEYDHLVPLELGGASDTRNLWVEADGKIPNAKDAVESELRVLVCGSPTGYSASAKRLDLTVAQELVATDWTTAVAKGTALIH